MRHVLDEEGVEKASSLEGLDEIVKKHMIQSARKRQKTASGAIDTKAIL